MPVDNLKYTGDLHGGSLLKQDVGHRSEVADICVRLRQIEGDYYANEKK
jgi:hypothetical protein